VAANLASRAVKSFSTRQRAAAAAGMILLILFLVRPGVSRLKARIANSITQAVARPTEIGSVHLRFLPRPGFDLENVVVYEDPAFGAEPMLRAPEVTAVVRLTSLVRGRLDISRLELTEPSLNLVRRGDGRWNWEALLERAARSPLAPTAKSKSESRPGFPYIAASSGRINFKSGAEKKPYALLNADFAVWQESENAWGVRLRAEPLRTDMNLSDTGLLRVNGTWQRAGSLRETPLQFTLAWDRAQLGQLSKLVTGDDKGWRGEVQMEARLSGTPQAMEVTEDTTVRNFHRYDIAASEDLRLAAHCEAQYSSAEARLHEIACSAPVGNGMITLRGDAEVPYAQEMNLIFNLDNVPAGAVAQLARRVKKDLPKDLAATGNVIGNFALKKSKESARGAEVQGRGEIANLRLQSASSRGDLGVASVPFEINSDSNKVNDRSRIARPSVARTQAEGTSSAAELRVEFGPFPVSLGRPASAQARGWISRSGYGMALRGEGDISRTLKVASLLGLQVMKANAEGAAQLDLQIAGMWSGGVAENATGFPLPRVMGTVQMRNVQATVRGTESAIEISSAELKLLPEEARLEKVKARAADADWNGSIVLARGCGTPEACVVHFNLNTDEAGLTALSKWLGPQANERRWYQVLSPAEPGLPSFLGNLRASGKLTVGRLLIHDVVAEAVSATLDIDHGKIKASDLRANLFGGKYRGDWQADLSGASALSSGTGTLTEASLEQVASAMHDPWISGTGSGNFQLKSSGTNATTFWQSAEGTLRFELRDGELSHINLADAEGPLQISHWEGRARLHDGKIEIEKGPLINPGGVYEISGTASFGQDLDFKLIRDRETKTAGSLVYSITGTVAEPRVAVIPAPETQANLKP
jgi:uncharacterized protein involved in outer membrane biogenesis